MCPKTTGILLVSGALVLTVLLFISPRQQSAAQAEKLQNAANPATGKESSKKSLDPYLQQALRNLPSAQRTRLDPFIAEKRYDSLVVSWDRLKRPDLASYYQESIAESQNSSEAWAKAGTRYYYAADFVRDENE